MPISDQLQQPSFRGFPFLVPEEEETGGRKAAIHEFAGSDERFVQDFGLLRPSFRIQALIHGLDLVQRRKDFTSILTQSGSGLLIHPYVGEVTCQVLTYSVRTSNSELGQAVYDIEFIQTQSSAITLGDVISGKADVFAKAATAREALDVAMLSKWHPLRISDSIQRVGARVNEALTVAQKEISTVANPVANVFNDFNTQASVARDKIFSIVRTPELITTAMSEAFTTAQSIADAPNELRRQMRNLSFFGSAQRLLPNGQFATVLGTIRDAVRRTTKKRRDENDNLNAIDQYMRIQGLIGSFEAEADATFFTDEELSNSRALLFDSFRRIIIDQEDLKASSFIGDEVLTDNSVTTVNDTLEEAKAFANTIAREASVVAAMEDLKTTALAVLSDDQKSPFKVSPAFLGNTDISLATHAFYGNLDLLSEMSLLNSGINVSDIRESFKVLLR